MKSWFVLITAGLIVGTFHYIRSLAHRPSAVVGAKESTKSGLLGFLTDVLDGMIPETDFLRSEISEIISMVFMLVWLPFMIVKNFFDYLIERCNTLIKSAKTRIIDCRIKPFKERKVEERIFEEPPSTMIEDDSQMNQSLLLSIISLVALLFFTAANYQILVIGLPIIWGVEKSVGVNFLGRAFTFSPIALLALLMIVAEFFFGLMGAEYRNRRSAFVKPSIRSSAICYIALSLFCLSEAILAVLRTLEMRSGHYAANLHGAFLGLQVDSYPYWVVAIISFAVPMIAAFAFEYSFRYWLWIGAGALILAANLVTLPLILAEAVVKGLRKLVLLLLELLAVPAKAIHQAFRRNKTDDSVRAKRFSDNQHTTIRGGENYVR